MLGSQILSQLAYVVSCEWLSKSSGFTTQLLMTCYMSKLWF